MLGIRGARTTDIARVAASTGHHAVLVDLEHSTMSLDVAAAICSAAHDLGLVPFVRTPEREYGAIGRLLDGGAEGIVAPRIETAEEAATVVGACRFPPRGQRSQLASVPSLGMRPTPAKTLNPLLDEATLVQILIETPRGHRQRRRDRRSRRRRHGRARCQRPDRRARHPGRVRPSARPRRRGRGGRCLPRARTPVHARRHRRPGRLCRRWPSSAPARCCSPAWTPTCSTPPSRPGRDAVLGGVVMTTVPLRDHAHARGRDQHAPDVRACLPGAATRTSTSSSPATRTCPTRSTRSPTALSTSTSR